MANLIGVRHLTLRGFSAVGPCRSAPDDRWGHVLAFCGHGASGIVAVLFWRMGDDLPQRPCYPFRAHAVEGISPPRTQRTPRILC